MTLETVREQPVGVESSRENVIPENNGASRVQPSSSGHSANGPKDTGEINHSTPVESLEPTQSVRPQGEKPLVTSTNGAATLAWETYYNKVGREGLKIIYLPRP